MTKTPDETRAAEFLSDPGFDPNTDVKKSLEGIDVTEAKQADISKRATTFLGQYLDSYVNDGRRKDGKDNELTEAQPFTDQDDSPPLDTLSFFEPDEVRLLLDKSGNDLLRDITSEGTSQIQRPGLVTNYVVPPPDRNGNSSYQQYVVKHLIESNLYHPSNESPFVVDSDSSNEEIATKGLFTIQRDLGEFVISPGSPEKDPASGQRVKVSDMTRIALALLAQAAGERNEANIILDGGEILGLGNILHTTEQLGIRGVPVSDLRIKELKSDYNDIQNLIAAARGSDDFFGHQGDELRYQTTNNGESYSQLNSFLEPFGSLGGSGGMLVIAIEGVLALLAVSLIISMIDGSVGGDSSYVDAKFPYQFAFGSRSKDESTSLLNVIFNLLRITDTDYDFGNCVESGIMLLLGFSPETGLAGFKAALSNPASLGAFALNLALSPSYYANLFRQVVRDARDVIKKFGEIGGTFTSALSSTVAAIEKLTSSKAYQFIMIAAAVGDAAIKSTQGQPSKTNESTLLKDQKIDPPVTVKNPPGFLRQHVSRWSGGHNPLSLHTFLASTVSQTETTGKISSSRSLVPDRKTVKKIESALEAEYMPFYFHDLRTHEIISLPAFITAFDEAFNINYTSTPGYGRQDSVKTYESTDRSMTFAFKLVAFNKEDFDEMWFLVNKLVAMCYPQYSKGRQRSYKDPWSWETGMATYQFTQPFSQIPAASPVIRLRLGDVLKSNYSAKGLQKQFGLVSVSKLREKLRLAEAEVMQELKEKFDDNPAINAELLGKLKYPSAIYTNITPGIAKHSPAKTWAASSIVDILTYSALGQEGLVKAETDILPTLIPILDPDLIAFNPKKAAVVVSVHPRVVAAKSSLDAAILGGGELSPDQIEKFFKPENNAIVRSFNSTRGKGLAGVITSLGLNYGEYPYETERGSRAPKMIDVSLGFSPIHDLPLGLDYEGKIRAPSHPVGSIMKGFGSVYEDEDKTNADRHREDNADLDRKRLQERLGVITKGVNDKSK